MLKSLVVDTMAAPGQPWLALAKRTGTTAVSAGCGTALWTGGVEAGRRDGSTTSIEQGLAPSSQKKAVCGAVSSPGISPLKAGSPGVFGRSWTWKLVEAAPLLDTGSTS